MTTLTTSTSGTAYTELLSQLPDYSRREDRAAILDTMAQLAAQAARIAAGAASGDSDDNPLGWHETATLLRCLAAAERGLTISTPDDGQADVAARHAWADLASAMTAEEYMAAFDAVASAVERRLAVDGLDLADSTPDPGRAAMLHRLALAAGQGSDPRGIALRRLSAAARACASAYPDHHVA
jgi:hypothetical protein